MITTQLLRKAKITAEFLVKQSLCCTAMQLAQKSTMNYHFPGKDLKCIPPIFSTKLLQNLENS